LVDYSTFGKINWVAILHQFTNLSKMRFKYFF
jgi:hypothetical protein